MRKNFLILILFGTLIGGCSSQEPALPPTSTPIEIEELVAEAILATQTAEEINFSPSFPYLPAEIALLADPGDFLGGGWQTSTVYDLTQPYPPLEGMCGGYYGGCGNNFVEIQSGAEVELLRDGDQLGEVTFVYTNDPEEIKFLYLNNFSRASEVDENMRGEVHNQIWLRFLNPYNVEELGDNWFHEVYYSLHEITSESTSEYRAERELLTIKIKIYLCHGYLRIEVRYPPVNPWNNPEDNMEKRLLEQEERFNLVYDYAQALIERITPYACNP